MAWTTPRTWTNNEVLNATIFNQHVRDNLQFLYDRFGGGNVTLAANSAVTLTVPTTGTAALRSGTPTTGRVASWASGTAVGDAGFAASDVARLSQANTFSASQRVNGTLAIDRAYSNHGGYGNVLDLQGGIALTRRSTASNTYLQAAFDVNGTTLLGYFMIRSQADGNEMRFFAASGVIRMLSTLYLSSIRVNPASPANGEVYLDANRFLKLG